ncbi:pilus assembly protein TadG-related protein [Aquisalinus flavus]|uniref:Putative Flp pilus-assembly TadG-like N-terminal domain-containing protein n=1 Tax=Aquisalinus flavus TaxID=1526572 RepID=A0A8J2V746_9PROT|nr:pilus assembly protein TadG-related protein [Aquisalinus flavus]MBD0427436.1 hypothetical protein [Aquisalinus flavus]GGD01006.1 hypothetical protein GCM10011342_07490 [Aquisalinus flavus]
MNRSHAALSRFRQACHGNISVLTAFMLLPMFTAAGLAVDGARLMLLKYELQGAADAAALAVGTTFDTQEELETLAESYLARNFQLAGASVKSVSVVSTAETVKITANAEMKTYFMKLVRNEDISVTANTQVNRAGGGLMVALVLDNTGSMWSGLNGTTRIEALRSASLSLTNSIMTKESETELRISVVPYASMVNPGSIAPSIVDTTITDDFRIQDPQNRTGLDDDDLEVLTYDPADKTQWKGCVYERLGNASFDDTPPSTTKWEPLIWPIYNDNQYEVETSGSDLGEIVGGTVDPGGDRNSNEFTGPNVGCPTPITPLTGTKSQVISALNAMTAWNRGGTFADIGMAWGIRTLSPGEPFTQSADYDDPKTGVPIWESNRWRRAIVLMTDGDNVVYNAGNEGSRVAAGSEGSDITGYGRLGEARMTAILGTSNSTTARNEVEDRLSDLCDTAKAQGITIYTVVFASSANTGTRQLYESCASDPGKYWFAPSADSLDNAFGAIGSELNKLRITR